MTGRYRGAGGGTTRTGERTRTRNQKHYQGTRPRGGGKSAPRSPRHRNTNRVDPGARWPNKRQESPNAPRHQCDGERTPKHTRDGRVGPHKKLCEAGGAELFALENCTNVSPRGTLVLVKITLEAACKRGCVHGIAGARGMGLRTCTNVSPRGTLVLVKTRL